MIVIFINVRNSICQLKKGGSLATQGRTSIHPVQPSIQNTVFGGLSGSFASLSNFILTLLPQSITGPTFIIDHIVYQAENCKISERTATLLSQQTVKK
jgi:hypothetical protein